MAMAPIRFAPLVEIPGGIILKLLGGDDSLTLDFGNRAFGLPIELSGGDGVNSLELQQGAMSAVAVTYESDGDGDRRTLGFFFDCVYSN